MPKNFFFEMTYDKFKKIADYRKAAVATLNYIATRENQQGEEMNRTLFGKRTHVSIRRGNRVCQCDPDEAVTVVACHMESCAD